MRLLVKRLIDILGSVLAMLLLALPCFLVALLIRIKLGRPILFTQLRPGLAEKPFRMIKFRTMADARDADGNLLADADRLSRFGQWLRATSADELPELWNVLTGSMSLVGPRPLLMEYLPLYSLEQNRRHEVKPGITGWAQINGRNAVAWDEKFALDVWYVDHRSVKLDLYILCMTLLKVLRREGINATGEATMPKFSGNVS